jgi:hypothetical protein
MRGWSDIKEHHEKWSANVLSQIKKIPNEADRLRLLIELEKVTLLSQIAQDISFYYESQ